MRFSLALVLLVGCSDPAPAPEAARGPTADPDLEKVRDALSGARTLRLRFKGEWPYAVGQMAKNVTGTLLLGEGARAKISQTLSYAPGSGTTFEAVSDGTRLWRNATVQAEKFDPGPKGLRPELLYALAWHGVGWSFPHGTHPKTIGLGYVVLDLVPKVRDSSPSWMEKSDPGGGVLNYACPGVDYRIRLTVDPVTRHPRKREMIGEKGAVWYAETYEVEVNPAIPDDEFKIPQ